MSLFYGEIISHEDLSQQVQTDILAQIARWRDDSGSPDYGLLSSVTRMLIDLEAYADRPSILFNHVVETAVVEACRNHYKIKANEGVDSCLKQQKRVHTYLQDTNAWLTQETRLADRCFVRETSSKVAAAIITTMVQEHAESILGAPESGFDAMVLHDRYEEILLAVELFRRFEGGWDLVKERIRNVLTVIGRSTLDEVEEDKVGKDGDGGGGTLAAAGLPSPSVKPSRAPSAASIDSMPTRELSSASMGSMPSRGLSSGLAGDSRSATQSSIQFVEELLKLQRRFLRLTELGFGGDTEIQTLLHGVIGDLLNAHETASEAMSLFIDDVMRRGLRDMDHNQTETLIQEWARLFRVLGNKDVFEVYHKQHLSKRLLQERSLSRDAEMMVVAEMKAVCGMQATYRLEGMFKDLQVSDRKLEEFRSAKEGAYIKQLGTMELEVKVLAVVNWASTGPGCKLTPELANACDVYNQFYAEKHIGRKLTWAPWCGRASLIGRFGTDGSRTYTLQATTFQAVTLLCFNDTAVDESITLKYLLERTGMPLIELKRSLHAMASGRCKLLAKTSPRFDESTTFKVNLNFTSKQTRVKIPNTNAASKENSAGRNDTKRKVDEDRRFQMDACLVRIMKARQTLSHNELVGETTQHLGSRFTPTPQAIKQRIEHLIEREFLQRSADDRRIYEYRA